MLHLQQLHRDACVEEAHGDAAAHGAGTDHGHLLDLAGGRVVGHIGDLAGGTLTKEGVLHGLGLRAHHEGQEDFALFEDAGVNVLLRGNLDGVNAALGRDQATACLGHVGTGLVEQTDIGHHRRRQIAHAGHRAHRRHLARKGQRACQQITLDQLGNQLLAGHLDQLVARNRSTAGHHLQGHVHRQDARQALRAATAGDQADVHLGQGHLCARRHHTVVTTQRQLQATAHHHTVDGGHDRLGAGLQRFDDRVQTRCGKRRRGAELTDVGPTAEDLAAADDDHGLHAGIGLRLLQSLRNASAGALAQSVDRRVAQGDDGHAVCDLVGGAHDNLGTL